MTERKDGEAGSKAQATCPTLLENRDRADWGTKRPCGNRASSSGFCKRHDPATKPKRDSKGRILKTVAAQPSTVKDGEAGGRIPDSKALRHFRHAKAAGIATACTAHHVNFGGGCLNCGFNEPEPAPLPVAVFECVTCAKYFEYADPRNLTEVDGPLGVLMTDPERIAEHRAAGHDVRPAQGTR